LSSTSELCLSVSGDSAAEIIGDDEDVEVGEITFSDELLVTTLVVVSELIDDVFDVDAEVAGKTLSHDMLGMLKLCAENPRYDKLE
jgi:hypothetical protein